MLKSCRLKIKPQIMRFPPLIILILILLLCACATKPPTWRSQAASLIEELDSRNGSKLFPVEYHNLLETFEHGDAFIYVSKNNEMADTYYLFALQKAQLLKNAIEKYEERIKDEERRLAALEAARIAEEALQLQIKEAEERLRLQQEHEIREQQAKRVVEKTVNLQYQEKSLRNRPTTYTVHRGETLPQIAARTEIYNDSSLWTLIYRANRDQVRDPKRLWPGQVLVIPRYVKSKK